MSTHKPFAVPGEAVDHQRDPVAVAGNAPDGNAREQMAGFLGVEDRGLAAANAEPRAAHTGDRLAASTPPVTR